MPQNTIDDKLTLVQVMVWCHQATNNYMSQCWRSSMLPFGTIGPQWINTLRPRQDGRHFPDDIFKCIFLNEDVWISIKISPKFVPKGPINNIPAMVQIMAWHRPGAKPLSEPMVVKLLTHICVTRPQWVEPSGWTPTHLIWKWILTSRSHYWPFIQCALDISW